MASDDAEEEVEPPELHVNLIRLSETRPPESQAKDKVISWLKKIINKELELNPPKLTSVQRKLVRMLDRFVIQDNIVYVKSISRFGDETLRYFVPFSDRKSTIESIHCVETGGHLGIDKTLD